MRDLTLLVCCHTARDARCGTLGPPLATALARAVRQRGLQQHVQVLATSHVGGHKYAGNVVVYGAVSGLPQQPECAAAAYFRVTVSPHQPCMSAIRSPADAGLQVHPCDGDWFGGVSEAGAEAFLDALLGVEVGCAGAGRACCLMAVWRPLLGAGCACLGPCCALPARAQAPTPTPALQLGVDGGAGDPALRPFWRGRMGLSKQEQAALFEQVRRGVGEPRTPCPAGCAAGSCRRPPRVPGEPIARGLCVLTLLHPGRCHRGSGGPWQRQRQQQ